MGLFAPTLFLTGCGGGGASYSLLPGQDTFNQNGQTINGKVDILFVIDNSGSMGQNQSRLSTNFAAWIQAFNAKGLDYHIAITTTDSYRYGLGDHTKNPDGTYKYSTAFRGGIMTSDDADVVSEFEAAALVGTTGSGDERALASFQATLSDPANAAFPRSDASFSIIMIGDEDDWAHAPVSGLYSGLEVWQPDTTFPDYAGYEPYVQSLTGNNPAAVLMPVSGFLSYLDTRLGVTASSRNYNIHAITVTDPTCLATYPVGAGQHIGYRYMDLATQAGGTVNSLCNDFAGDLTNISNSIIELTTKFFLTRTPVAGTLVVQINGVAVASDPTNGYTYSSSDNSVSFHGSAVPSAGTSISVAFQPTSL